MMLWFVVASHDSVRWLEIGGSMTPRSFCGASYFQDWRGYIVWIGECMPFSTRKTWED